VAAVSYDPGSGLFTVRPESAVWAMKLRPEQARVVQAANELIDLSHVDLSRVKASAALSTGSGS
jgi:hypothetical protein